MEVHVQGRMKRGRPKRRWLDRVRYDIKEKGLSTIQHVIIIMAGMAVF